MYFRVLFGMIIFFGNILNIQGYIQCKNTNFKVK